MIEFFAKLGIPDSCYLGKRIFKKLFYDNTKLNATDKKAFINDIEEIEWTYTLKPETINIQRYEDDEHEYLEVAIIQVKLKENFRYKRIAQIIQRSIPYPVIIVFKHDLSIALNMALKRINRADQNKIMVKEFHYTDWINLENPLAYEITFFESLEIKSFSYDNFYQWYTDFLQRVVALNCAQISGNYVLSHEEPGINRVEELEQIYNLEQKQTELRATLKKETQFSNKVDLNIQIKKITQQIDGHKSRI
jgi:hypothetical protein